MYHIPKGAVYAKVRKKVGNETQVYHLVGLHILVSMQALLCILFAAKGTRTLLEILVRKLECQKKGLRKHLACHDHKQMHVC